MRSKQLYKQMVKENTANLYFLCFDSLSIQTHKAMEIGKQGKVQVEDIMYLMRKDPKKYSRVKDLLLMNEELKKARKAFDEVKYATYG